MSETPDNTKSARPLRKTRVGRVVSVTMDKTAVVESTNRVPHPKFGKIIKQSKRFYVHDEKNEAKVGDFVEIMETRPISKQKCWRLVAVKDHDATADIETANA